MSWHCSRALAEEYLAVNCLDGEQSAQLNTTPMPEAYYWPDKTTEHSRLSRFGMTPEPLTEGHGEALLMWYLAGFRVKPIPQQLRVKIMQMISGRKCDGSWQMSLPGTYMPKTSADALSTAPQTILNRWVIKPKHLHYPRLTWVVTTFGSVIGYLHTPTTKANYCADSMMKWPSAKAYKQVFGRPSPANHEWMMGWPIGWTDLRPLETGKFQLWRRQHSLSLQADLSEVA